ncbi:hypothetical protein [Roseivivax sp. THAF30]|uniref:hypothetical protein n=1 Tax=Roseivivax sp. THAF30 TaxID=2587852 RepID=UPI001267B4C7|nr:hypothetical protein [Roseivivax sp. THAF30]QFT62759.1 hypothetical protein FIU91_07450 [Roseivivax sp. THAF30]
MIQMGSGAFDRAEVERFAKGGPFFTSEPMSLAEFIELEAARNPDKERGEDLYHMAAKRFEGLLAEKISEGQTGGRADAHLRTLRVLDALSPDFALGTADENGVYSPSVERSVTKNPLTVFLYGSGNDGIAAKIANAVLDEFYPVLSELSQSGANWKDHPLFAGTTLAQDLAGIFGMTEAQFSAKMAQPQSFVPNRTQIATMRGWILEGFAEPMMEAVDAATGGLAADMKMTQAASQVQAAVFKDIFSKALNQRQDEKGEMLSEAEMKEVFEEISVLAPIYKTDAQSFHILKPVRETTEKVVSKSLTGRFSTKASVFGPNEASVKVSPYLTIGTGDGRMMLNIYVQADGSLDVSLPVFDGVELAVDQIEAGSGQINKAVFDGWIQGNVYEALAEGFFQMSSMISEETLNALEPETIKAIRRALKLKSDERLSPAHIQGLQKTLERKAREVKARKFALSQVASQTDHMAAGATPHTNSGQTTPSDDALAYDEIAEALNGFYAMELKRLEAEETAPKSYAQEATEGMATLIEEIGEAVPNHEGVRAIRGDQLLAAISAGTDSSMAQMDLFWDVLKKDPSFREARYFFGEAKALEAFRDQEMPDLAKQPIQLGQTHIGAGVVFIANASPETVLHEMLHTMTGRILIDHYRSPETTPHHIKDAVKRLEDQMAEIRMMNPAAFRCSFANQDG